MAERYEGALLPKTSKKFVILRSAPDPELEVKRSLSQELLDRLDVSVFHKDSPHSAATGVLMGMYFVDEHLPTSARPRFGVTYIREPNSEGAEAGSQRDLTWSVLHELGHHNMHHTDGGAGRYDDSTWHAADSERISGWEKHMPKELAFALRVAVRGVPAEDVPRSSFASDKDYETYQHLKETSDRKETRQALEFAKSIVNETYADALTVLSTAYKDGKTDGLAMAEHILDFRNRELDRFGAKADDHNTVRSLQALQSYLKSPAGDRFLGQLQGQESARGVAQEIHEKSFQFAELGVRRWGQDQGLPPEVAAQVSTWIGDYMREGARMEQPDKGRAKIEVYDHSVESILTLGASLGVRPVEKTAAEPQREMSLERKATP